MQVAKWGNSLAVRLPAAVVDALGLKEGDQLEITVDRGRRLRVARDTRREDAVARLAQLGWVLPPDYQFAREEANARGPEDRAAEQALTTEEHAARARPQTA